MDASLRDEEIDLVLASSLGYNDFELYSLMSEISGLISLCAGPEGTGRLRERLLSMRTTAAIVGLSPIFS